MPPGQLSLRSLGRATLARQLLLERVDRHLPDVVSATGGLQAQEPKPPFLGLWNRLANFSPDLLVEAAHHRSRDRPGPCSAGRCRAAQPRAR